MNLFDTFEKMEFQKFPTKLYTQNIDIIGELLPINHSNLKNNDGKTLLMCLCSNNNIYYDKILDFYNTFNLKYSDYIITDNLGNTAFIYSCMNKNSILAINYFLNELKYNDLITQNNDGNSALMMFCQNTSINSDLLSIFTDNLKYNDLITQNNDGNTALMMLCQNTSINFNLLSRFTDILKYNDLITQNNNGNTALMMLCQNTSINSDLLSRFTDNLKYNDLITQNNNGHSALMMLCQNTSINSNLLSIFTDNLKYNDLITQNNDGNSALMILCQNNKSNEKIFKLFISKIKPTDLVIKNKKGNIALMYIMYYNPYFLNLFIENPKDLIIQNNDGNTPLMYLCYSPSINMIDYDLISFNDFIFNQINKYGQTALIILCMNTNIQYYILYYLINTLLNNDIYIKDNKNKNALNYLSENKYIKIETPCYFSNEKYKLDYYYLFIKDFTCKKNFIDEIGMNEYKLYEKEFDKYFLDKAFDFY